MDPQFLYMLTQDYLNLMQQVPPATTDDRPSVKSAKRYDFDGLDMVVDADDLFEQARVSLQNDGFYHVVYDGKPGSGKSTAACELTLKAEKLGYKVLYSSGFEVFNAPEDFRKRAAGHDKVCAIFDDLSYVMGAVSGKTSATIKSFFGLIRHMLKAKVLAIVIGHFPTSVPPILKNADAWIFTKPTTFEYETMMDLVGRGEKNRISLEKKFEHVTKIQAQVKKEPIVKMKVRGKPYQFRWGNQEDPGDGRIVLGIIDKKPVLFNTKHVSKEECERIGFKVNINDNDYKFKDRDDDENQHHQSGGSFPN